MNNIKGQWRLLLPCRGVHCTRV